MQKRQLWIFKPLLLFLLCCTFLFQYLFIQSQNLTNDFCSDYFSAAALIRSQPSYFLIPIAICWPRETSLVYHYNIHPPTSVLFFVPFTLLSLANATRLWDFLNIILFFSSLYLLLKISKLYRPVTLLIIFILSSFWPTLLSAYEFRNLFFLLFVLILLSLISIKQHPKVSGFLIGIAALIKIWPLVFLGLGFINQKYRRFLLYGIITVVIGVIFSLILLGKDSFIIYAVKALPQEPAYLSHFNNISLTSIVSKSSSIITPVSVQIYIKIIFLIFLFISSILIYRFFLFLRLPTYSQNLPYIFFSTAMIFYFVFSPLSWDNSSFILLLPLAVHLRYRQILSKYINSQILIPLVFGYLIVFIPQIIKITSNIYKYLSIYNRNLSVMHILTLVLLSSLPLLILICQLYLFSKAREDL